RRCAGGRGGLPPRRHSAPDHRPPDIGIRDGHRRHPAGPPTRRGLREALATQAGRIRERLPTPREHPVGAWVFLSEIVAADPGRGIADHNVVLGVVALEPVQHQVTIAQPPSPAAEGEVALASAVDNTAKRAPNAPLTACPTGVPVRTLPMVLREGPIWASEARGVLIEQPHARST